MYQDGRQFEIRRVSSILVGIVVALLLVACVATTPPASQVIDHPPDPGAARRAGGPLPGLSAAQLELFEAGKDAFNEIDTVKGSAESSAGLGPRFNLNSCGGCHGFPASGGSSGFVNPEPIVAKLEGARNDAPIPFLHADGPIVEARFKVLMAANGTLLRQPDGGVHALFTIAGRTDAAGCDIAQPGFERAWNSDNVTLRIPTPVFGLGLIEAISEATIKANSLETLQTVANATKDHDASNGLKTMSHSDEYWGVAKSGDMATMYRQLGIVGRPGRGRENRSGNDSTITRFGWKAQNKSLLLFAGEAYNVEQGVTNELFPNERDEEATVPLPAACQVNATPEDDTKLAATANAPDARHELRSAPLTGDFTKVAGDLVKFELFMRMLAPPLPACDMGRSGSCADNIIRGSQVFDDIYCAACHVRQLKLGPSSIPAITAQRFAHLYSDLLLHKMGVCAPNANHTARCLADGISQGQAQADEFRTAPLWGAGQRVFFLHDGRARDLPTAILAHRGPGSEANVVIKLYEKLPDTSKQDLIDFLRSL